MKAIIALLFNLLFPPVSLARLFDPKARNCVRHRDRCRFPVSVLFAISTFALIVCGCARPAAHLTTNTPHQLDYPATPQELDHYLKQLSTQNTPPTERVIEIGRKFIGQQYVLGPLGEFPFELYDPDPLYRLDASDCVTFVEQSWAMAMSSDWVSFIKNLVTLRYKDGQIGIRTRNHFTEADWNINNAWAFDDVTSLVADGNVQRFELTIDRTAFFAKLGVSVSIPVQKWKDTYISASNLPGYLGHIKSGDIVEFVKNPQAPFVGHMGLLSVETSGMVKLIHASRPAVKEEELLQYLSAHPNFAGVKILRFRGTPIK